MHNPKNGYAFVAVVPRETNFHAIDNESWEISLIEVFDGETFTYLGRREIDSVACHVWWADEGDAFIAQKLVA